MDFFMWEPTPVGDGLLLWEPTPMGDGLLLWEPTPVGDGLHGVCHPHRPQGWVPTKNFA